ncbi:MAG TPA: hypothetical protein VEQ85_13320, partial [Lacipirellulaceae bacterium]|nr:hypothetical protein [Lacipirellulaceae bacterium]
MPATEQTWRDQKKMHVIFAISALIMGVATIWMMAADQMREWKDWQLKDRRKDAWMLASRRDSLAAQYSGEMGAYQANIRRLDSQPVDGQLISQFKQRVAVELVDKPEDEPAEAAAAVDVQGDPRFAALDQRVKELDEAAAKAAEARTASEAAQASAPRDASAGEGGAEPPAAAPATPASSPEAAAARAAADSAENAAIAARRALFEEMNRFILEARRREDALAAKKKSVNGQRTAIVSELGIAIGEGASEDRTAEIQGHIDQLDSELDELTTQIADAKSYRLDLEAFVAEANAEKTVLSKQLDAMQTELDRLSEQVYKNTSNFGEWMTRWPVLNALYSGNIRVDQIWLPDMTINYNFAQTARFDRCTTCHRAISTTAPGTATDPLYPSLPREKRELTVQLATPAEPIDVPADDDERVRKVVELYGLALSETGIINDADVTVHYVLPESAAAKAGLQA